MTFVPTPNGIEVVIKANRGPDARINVLHVMNNAGEPMSEAIDYIAGAVAAWVFDSYRARVTDKVGFDQVRVRDISVVNGYEHVTDSGNAQGQVTGDPLPGHVICLTTLHTATPGRSGTGRIYNFEPGEGQLDNGVWGGVYTAATTTSWNALQALLQARSLPLAVLSKKLNLVLPVTSFTSSPQIATQRDRLPGRRAHRRRAVSVIP